MVKLLLGSALTPGHRARLIVVLGLSLCLLPSTVAAQPTLGQPAAGAPSGVGIASAGRAERPYRGIFGSGTGSSDQRLIFEASFGGGSNQVPSTVQGVPDQGQGLGDSNGGGTATGSGKLEYSVGGERVGMNGSNTFYTNYYPNLAADTLQFRDIASGAVYFAPAKTTRLTVSLGYKNLPEFAYSELFGPEMSDLIPLTQDYPIKVERFRRYGTSVDVSQKLASRVRMDAGLAYGNGKVTNGLSWTTFMFSGIVTYQIAKGVGINAGYGYGTQTTQDAALNESVDRHPTVRFGVDFNRALSFSRRTTVSFGTGISQVHDRIENTTTKTLIGSAQLTREFGRSWSASLGFIRDARFVESIAQPLFKDALSVVVNGSFTRRMQWKSGAGASTGHVGSSTQKGFDTFFASAQYSVAVTRYVAVAADYSYSKLSSAVILVGQPLGQDWGQSFRMQMQVWLPLMMKTRSAGGSGKN